MHRKLRRRQRSRESWRSRQDKEGKGEMAELRRSQADVLDHTVVIYMDSHKKRAELRRSESPVRSRFDNPDEYYNFEFYPDANEFLVGDIKDLESLTFYINILDIPQDLNFTDRAKMPSNDDERRDFVNRWMAYIGGLQNRLRIRTRLQTIKIRREALEHINQIDMELQKLEKELNDDEEEKVNNIKENNTIQKTIDEKVEKVRMDAERIRRRMRAQAKEERSKEEKTLDDLASGRFIVVIDPAQKA